MEWRKQSPDNGPVIVRILRHSMLPAWFQVSRISPGIRSAVSYTYLPPLRFRPCTKTSSLDGTFSPLASSNMTALFSTSLRRRTNNSTNLSAPDATTEGTTTTTAQALPGKLEPRLSLTFTCTVVQCGERSTHEFSKRAYTSGIVLVQCPKCKNRCVADKLNPVQGEGT